MSGRRRFVTILGLVLVGIVAGLFVRPLFVWLTGIEEPNVAHAPTIDEGPADAVAEGSSASTAPAPNAELQSAYEERIADMPAEVAEPLARDLSMIESVIAEIGAALVNDPDNESLKQMLVATYRNQIKVLKQALRIVGDDAEDYAGE